MQVKICRHRIYRDLRRRLIGEMKHTCRYTTERHASDPMLQAAFHNALVALFQVIPVFVPQSSVYDRPYGMNHIFCRQVVAAGQECLSCRFLIILPIFFPHPAHILAARVSKLYPCKSVNTIINTCVHRHEAAQHLRIGRVDDRSHLQPRNIALPYGNPVPMPMGAPQFLRHRLYIFRRYDPLLFGPLAKILVLHPKNFPVHLPRHPDIHKRPKNLPSLLLVLRYLHIPISYRVFLESFHKVVKPFFLIHVNLHSAALG